MGNLPITREKAIEVLRSMPNEKAEMNHYLESEAIMRGIAKKFGEDENYWGMLGLLHDVDWALTKDNWAEHTIKAEKILKEAGFDNDFIQIVQSHAYSHKGMPVFLNKQRTKKVEYALSAAETMTGIIHAYALMRGKKISDMEVSGLKKKFKDKAFAAGCDRETIMEIEKAGIILDEFFKIAIESMKNIKSEIGLE